MRHTPLLLALALAAAAFAVDADTPQSLAMTAGDAAFEADDDTITLVPIRGSFALSASTKGAAAHPPPTTRIDRVAITCDGFVEGQPFVLDAAAFERSTCDVTFTIGTRPMGGDPDRVYALDKDSGANRLEVTRAAGKVIEGTFRFDLVAPDGATLALRGGRFVAEDRQD